MSIIEDEDILMGFIEESNEHLESMESDLLEIEQMANDLDLDFVNKVFRAIHSIKGAAGFLGLETIKDLSHHMENLLNLIRNSELVPTSPIINVLLTSSDILRNMINDYANSNDVDISEQVAALTKAANGTDGDESQEKQKEICLPGGRVIFTVSEEKIERMQKAGNFIYLAEYDLKKDIEAQNLTPIDVVKEIQNTGILIDSEIDVESVEASEDFSGPSKISFFTLVATILEPDLITALIKIDESNVHFLSKSGEMKPLTAWPESEKKAAKPKPDAKKAPVDAKTPSQESPLPEKVSETPQQTPASPQKEKPKTASPKQTKQKAPKKTAKKSSPLAKKTSTSLRVNVNLLDNLMTLAGELVLTRNQLVQSHSGEDNADLATAIQRVDLVTSELQEAIMSTRMQPIGTVFSKFQRVVRDLSRNLGKEIDLIIEGKEVDLDKTIIEAIGDPLTHLVRNSCDHGIEMPEVRKAAGKKLPATLTLRAYHEAGQVLIEIEDDGAGIDANKVKSKALETGNFDPSYINSLTENELIKLIFRPGFSLAKKVTEVSGRGVGMDVVHSNLTKLGGAIDIDTKVGVGTTVRIKLPLTLAIIPSLILMIEKERYAIPQVNLVELVRISAAEVKNKIEQIDDALVMRLRGELLPLVRLSDALNVTPTFTLGDKQDVRFPDRRKSIADRRGKKWAIEENEASVEAGEKRREDSPDRRTSTASAFNIIVVNAGEMHYGLIVDILLDSEEIVVKPLGQHLRDLHTYAGATILGDGRAALILDVMGIRNAMNLRMVKDKIKEAGLMNEIKNRQDAQSLLIVRNSPNEQFAIPLGLVSRIEKIKKSDIEMTGGKKAVKYRGVNLLLFSIDEVAEVSQREDVDHPFVVIFTFQKREVGILISHIVDVIESDVKIDGHSFRQPGIMGSAIIFDQITLLVDLYGIIAAVMPEWVEEKWEDVPDEDQKSTILVVEDSKFFRNQVKSFAEASGYNVVTAEDGLEALEVFNKAEEQIDLVLTDIEMPNLDGIGMTERIRRELQLQDLPVIALTTVAWDATREKAFKAGVDEYLNKLNREEVLERVEYYLKNGRS